MFVLKNFTDASKLGNFSLDFHTIPPYKKKLKKMISS